ncbi:MAG TPA: tetratricopeptide repeat protein [Pirellulales bacterium]|nr:tetratricopeptide repeat protein [Pirellulales bacterium]
MTSGAPSEQSVAARPTPRRLELWGSALVMVLVVAWTCVMILSLKERFLDRFCQGTYQSALGADFFCNPRGFRNLAAGSNIFLTQSDNYGPYATQFLSHPMVAVVVGSWTAKLPTWTAFGSFVGVSLVLLALSAGVLAAQFQSRLLQAFTFFAIFCSLPTYLMLWNAQTHVLTILAVALMLAALVALERDESKPRVFLWMLQIGLLVSLLSKPVVLLALPVMVAARETRRALVWPIVAYAAISVLFLIVPALNSGGYNGFHWLNMLNASSSRAPLNKLSYPHEFTFENSPQVYAELYSLPVYAERRTGSPVPQALLKLPLLAILATSVLPLFLESRGLRIRLVLATLMLCLLSHFLCFKVVWEYHYTTVLPALPVLWWMAAREDRAPFRWLLRVAFAVLLFNFLPTPSFLGDPESQGLANVCALWRLIPVAIAFGCLLLYAAGVGWAGWKAGLVRLERGQLRSFATVSLVLALSGAAVAASLWYSVPVRLTKPLAQWTKKDWLTHWLDIQSRPYPGLSSEELVDIGTTLTYDGKPVNAIPMLERAIKLEPENGSANFLLGLAMHEIGKTSGAREYLGRALRLEPNRCAFLWPTALILATSPDATVRNGRQAVELAEKAGEICGRNKPQVMDALAAGLAETGHFSAAVDVAEQAAAIAINMGNEPLADTIRHRLSFYRRSLPFRETLSWAAESSPPDSEQ